jgi:hypothetical protein
MKIQSFDIIHSIPKIRKTIWGYRAVRVKVVLEYVGANENDARMHVAWKYSPACLKT